MVNAELFEKLPKNLFYSLILISIILIGFIDYITGWEISLSVLYLVPVLIAAWFLGGRAGTYVAIVSTVTSLTADIMWGVSYSHRYIPYWNALTRCILFLVIVNLVAAIRKHFKGLQETVVEQTSSLTKEITGREATEKMLQMVDFSVDNIADGIYWFSADCRFWKVNEAACSMLGYTCQEMLSMAVPDIIDQEYIPESWLPHLMNTAKSRRFEAVHLRKDGSKIPVEVITNCFFFDGIEHYCAVVRDITERKEAQSLRDQLSQTQRIDSIGRLAGGIAHDFNNLLTPIIGYSELLKINMQPDNQDMKKINSIIDAAHKARILTQQMLSFGRKQQLEMMPVDLNEVVSSFYNILHRTIRESIDLRLCLSQEPTSIQADKNQLEQIIMNLVVNAQDSINDKGIITIETARVTLDEDFVKRHVGAREGVYIGLVVKDTGTGMDQETIANIFEPFFTTKDIGKGTGLGLATVYGIVKQHEGYITVDSAVGNGSIFEIYFPIASDAPLAEKAPVSVPPRLDARGRTVLLAEDNDGVRKMVYDLLNELGFRIIEAANPKKALELAESKLIDLLVTDIVMPDMNGVELFDLLSASNPALKVVYMSGYANKVLSKHNIPAGARFIQKPFTVSDLSKAIDMVLDDN